MNTLRHALTALGLLALMSCGPDEPPPEVFTWGAGASELPTPEVFTWGDCSIEFSPPPAVWTRQRSQGPLEGVRFRIARVPPGFIDVTYYRSLHRSHTVTSLASGREQRFDPPAPGFTLADVVDRVSLDPESFPHPERVHVQPEVERWVDGQPALGVDYTWEDVQHTFHGRELYAVAGEHLFVAKVRGIEADLELFEQLVATIRFFPEAP